MNVDPFLIPRPAVVSFSGGRSSARMLWGVLQAYGGELPSDILVCAANTGREMPATLDFIRDCQDHWRVPIHLLEYRWRPGKPYVVEVTHATASRAGEPFQALLKAKSSLPNPVQRFCTQESKIRTIKRFVRSLGWAHWTNAVGLRADEHERVKRLTDPASTRKDCWDVVCPLFDAGIMASHVMRFWRRQNFDLRLSGPWEGNCDGCFLKSRSALQRMLAEHPSRMQWWEDMEIMKHGVGAGGTFRNDRESYATMTRVIRDQGRLPLGYEEIFGPCENGGCGV